MKKLFLIWFSSVVVSAFGTLVTVPTTSMFGGGWSGRMQIETAAPMLTDGTNLFLGTFINIPVAGGINPTNQLAPNNYSITFSGVNTKLRIAVPDTNAVLNALALVPTNWPVPTYLYTPPSGGVTWPLVSPNENVLLPDDGTSSGYVNAHGGNFGINNSNPSYPLDVSFIGNSSGGLGGDSAIVLGTGSYGGGSSVNGGNLSLYAGSGYYDGENDNVGGSISLGGGNSDGGSGAYFSLSGANGGYGGDFSITSGYGAGTAGSIVLTANSGGSGYGSSGTVTLQTPVIALHITDGGVGINNGSPAYSLDTPNVGNSIGNLNILTAASPANTGDINIIAGDNLYDGEGNTAPGNVYIAAGSGVDSSGNITLCAGSTPSAAGVAGGMVLITGNTEGGYVANPGVVAVYSGTYSNTGYSVMADGVGDAIAVNGDVQFSDSLGTTFSFLRDNHGAGGTTMMLQSQDYGDAMYLHVLSDGTSSWDSSP